MAITNFYLIQTGKGITPYPDRLRNNGWVPLHLCGIHTRNRFHSPEAAGKLGQ